MIFHQESPFPMAKQKWGWSQPTYKQVLGPDPPSRFLPSRNQVVLLILALVGLLQPLSVLCWATFATITFPARVASGRGLRLVNRYRFLFHRFKPSCASESLGEERFRSGLGQSGGFCILFFLSSLHLFQVYDFIIIIIIVLLLVVTIGITSTYHKFSGVWL